MRGAKECGYVALEFALGMGMLVLPTALVLLQIPGYLEQKDRVNVIAATVAQECANKASSADEAQTLANQTARTELDSSTSLNQATLTNASCTFTSGSVKPGAVVKSSVSISVPAAVIPGMPREFSWTMNSTHDVIVPKYRSVDE